MTMTMTEVAPEQVGAVVVACGLLIQRREQRPAPAPAAPAAPSPVSVSA